MLNPPLTAADVGGLFETTDGERAFVYNGLDAKGDFRACIADDGVYYVNASGATATPIHTLARRLPTSDPITELERRVVDAAVAYHSLSTLTRKRALSDATHALIAARRPHARRVDSPEALFDVMTSAGIDSTHARIKAVFNALPEVGE